MLSLEKNTNKTIKLISQVDGRDKLYKTAQYAARVAWWVSQHNGADKATQARFSGLDSSLSEARRVFRLGGFVREAKDLLRHVESRQFTTYLEIFKFINNAANLLGECLDVLMWATKIRAINVARTRVEYWRNLLWMTSILYCLTDNIVTMRQILQHRHQLLAQKQKLMTHNDVPITEHIKSRSHLNGEIHSVHEKMSNASLTLVRYISDFILCSASLRSFDNKGVIGAIGLVSGYIGLNQTWKKL